MLVSDFDYNLPLELIAQHPAERRDGSRMLVMKRGSGGTALDDFSSFANFLRSGDCLVLNDTRVIPARLAGRRMPSGGAVEAFMLEQQTNAQTWQALLRPGRRLRPGSIVVIEGSKESFVVEEKLADGSFLIRFSTIQVHDLLQKHGHTPLPPYIARSAEPIDEERYQTVFAKVPGAVAAPTAGLHFTPEILNELEERGVRIARLTLHVGAGTFKPVDCEKVEEHKMHAESFVLGAEAAECINACKQNGGKVFCVGTTTVRVLESCHTSKDGILQPQSGRTAIFLYPPYRPVVADGLLTNFHLPKSTLLMLVCCFAAREHVLAAYRKAIDARMRFFSYGDCMLLLPEDRDIIK
ncbi:MAG: tRNA preQ1(34) S-adenosylmethionine ribosyltransferase-isomerase QueA [Oligosphaeraceae bacterium]|nr:tRNA preQ1(34) S-adenosylmethionine ribosyltransferase-isomerase QueA [Oligosphaeraceae bacterium]